MFWTLTQYDKSFESLVAFPPSDSETTLAAEISCAGFFQSHIAETEKYPHVTYFSMPAGKNRIKTSAILWWKADGI